MDENYSSNQFRQPTDHNTQSNLPVSKQSDYLLNRQVQSAPLNQHRVKSLPPKDSQELADLNIDVDNISFSPFKTSGSSRPSNRRQRRLKSERNRNSTARPSSPQDDTPITVHGQVINRDEIPNLTTVHRQPQRLEIRTVPSSSSNWQSESKETRPSQKYYGQNSITSPRPNDNVEPVSRVSSVPAVSPIRQKIIVPSPTQLPTRLASLPPKLTTKVSFPGSNKSRRGSNQLVSNKGGQKISNKHSHQTNKRSTSQRATKSRSLLKSINSPSNIISPVSLQDERPEFKSDKLVAPTFILPSNSSINSPVWNNQFNKGPGNTTLCPPSQPTFFPHHPVSAPNYNPTALFNNQPWFNNQSNIASNITSPPATYAFKNFDHNQVSQPIYIPLNTTNNVDPNLPIFIPFSSLIPVDQSNFYPQSFPPNSLDRGLPNLNQLQSIPLASNNITSFYPTNQINSSTSIPIERISSEKSVEIETENLLEESRSTSNKKEKILTKSPKVKYVEREVDPSQNRKWAGEKLDINPPIWSKRPDYANMSAMDQAAYRGEFQVQMGILRERYPHYNLPVFGDDVPLEVIHGYYEAYYFHFNIRNVVRKWEIGLIVIWFGIEALFRKGLGLKDFNGYGMNQLSMLSMYEFWLYEFVEKGKGNIGAGLGPEIKIILMTIISAVIFLAIRYVIASWVGLEGANSIQQLINNLFTGGENVVDTAHLNRHIHLNVPPAPVDENNPQQREPLPGIGNFLGGLNIASLLQGFGQMFSGNQSNNQPTNSSRSSRHNRQPPVFQPPHSR